MKSLKLSTCHWFVAIGWSNLVLHQAGFSGQSNLVGAFPISHWLGLSNNHHEGGNGYYSTMEQGRSAPRCCTCRRHLIPIRRFHDSFTFLAQSDQYRHPFDAYGRYYNADVASSEQQQQQQQMYELCVVEESDLPDLAQFIVTNFGTDVVRVGSDVNALERLIMTPVADIVNGYSGMIAFAEVLAGMRSRLADRRQPLKQQPYDDTRTTRNPLLPPSIMNLPSRSVMIQKAARSSLILALAKRQEGSDWHIDVIASIELRLQPCDAKIPFTLPWLDRMERSLVSGEAIKDLQPYLSNLCVDKAHRRRNIGRSLVRCVENIALQAWGYDRMYLHVDLTNKAALQLYTSEGYRDAGSRWNPFWAGQSADIGYFCRKCRCLSTKE